MTKKPKTPEPAPPLQHWTIYRVRGTPAAAIGTVEAPDEATAIAKAIEEFAIEPQHRSRLIAVRRS
jgi:hypothetical protein